MINPDKEKQKALKEKLVALLKSEKPPAEFIEQINSQLVDRRTFHEEIKTYYREYFDVNVLWEVIDEESFSTREIGIQIMELKSESKIVDDARNEVASLLLKKIDPPVGEEDDASSFDPIFEEKKEKLRRQLDGQEEVDMTFIKSLADKQFTRVNVRVEKGYFRRNVTFDKPEYLVEHLSLFPSAGVYIGALYEDQMVPGRRDDSELPTKNRIVGRELLFDFDMDEYDPIRFCDCTGREVCEQCWIHMQETAMITDDILRIDFGLEDLVWVYTGGRGYHCWVLDKKVFKLTRSQRSDIIGYLQLIMDPKNRQKIKKVDSGERFMRKRIIEKLAPAYVRDMDVDHLQEEAGLGPIQAKRVKKNMPEKGTFEEILKVLPADALDGFMEGVIKYRYPRFDHKVTIDMNRLIRMPGSIHLGTSNIAEIIDNPWEFNPLRDATSMYDVLGKSEEEDIE